MGDWVSAYDEAFYAKTGAEYMKARFNPKTIYCISEGSGLPAKIGMSQWPGRRFSLIASHTWRPLFLCWTADGNRLLESALKFVTRHIVMRGEWLHDQDDSIKSALPHDASMDDLRKLVNDLAERFTVDPVKPARQSRQPGIQVPRMSFGRRASA